VETCGVAVRAAGWKVLSSADSRDLGPSELKMHTLADCKKTPHLMGHPNADRGLCSFSGTLMALLDRKDYRLVDPLFHCAKVGGTVAGVAKSAQIKSRLQKRIDHGIIPNDEGAIDDWLCCLGLMILFKEWSKQAPNNAWDQCKSYSDLFPGFKYNELKLASGAKVTKLKQLPSNAVMDDDVDGFKMSDLSYKKGDFAMPPSVLPLLLGLAGLSVSKTKVLISDAKTVGSLKNWQLFQLRNKLFLGEMFGSQNTGKGSHKGVMLGVADYTNPREDLASEYNVVHWVYVPPVATQKPKEGDFWVWSWGLEASARDLVYTNQHLVPVWAAYLA
jgi:hypothetical protein